MTGAGGYLTAVDKASARDLERLAQVAKKRGRAGDPPGADTRPEVIVRKGRIHESADAAEVALLAKGLPFYARGDVLVRLTFGAKTAGVRRDDSLPSLVPASGPMLLEAFEASARFVAAFKLKDGTTEIRPVGCPPQLPAVYLGRVGRWQVQPVRAVACVPVVHPDGTIVREGYDARSRAVVCSSEDWGAIPTKPTKSEAEAALLPLRALLGGFVFVDPSDEATAIAAMLSAVLRPSLSTCPGFGFTAPVRGSGKSKLADVCAVLATGRPSAAVSWPPKEEEAEKRLGATLLAGDPVVCLDNLETPLRSAALNSAMTQSEVAIRVLGSSSMPRVQVASLFLATGNNLVIQGDLSRRFLVCHIDPGIERPETREFKFCPVARARQERVPLVRALLTIAMWGRTVEAQRPPLGSFEDWSRRVRDPLIALGLADPCASLDTLHREDPEREAAVEVLTEWRRAFGDRAVTVADAIVEAGRDGPLRGALDAVAGGPGGINPRRLGRYLLRQRDRLFGAMVVRQHRDLAGNTASWAVEDRRVSGLSGSGSAIREKASGYETVRG
jgi:putative DNA primase/helicase